MYKQCVPEEKCTLEMNYNCDKLPTTRGPTTCGDFDVVDDRIVGGDKAVKHSIPWQVYLKINGGELRCGGTIIDSTHILTAAHCTKGRESIEVFTGEHDLSDARGDTRHNIKSIVNHPRHVGPPTSNDYDYSIITIDCNEEIDLTDKARAACLPESDAYEVSGAMFNVSGWGISGWGTELEFRPDILKVVTVPFVSDSVCKDKYEAVQKPITEQMICAGNVAEGGIDSCGGDSGGPLTWRDAQGKWNVIGVVSWGSNRCGDRRFPGVYAEVYKVLDWIKSNTQAGGHEQC